MEEEEVAMGVMAVWEKEKWRLMVREMTKRKIYVEEAGKYFLVKLEDARGMVEG